MNKSILAPPEKNKDIYFMIYTLTPSAKRYILFRELEDINIPELRRNFWSYSRHVNRRITGYVTVDATKKTIKKASKFGILIFGSSLNINQ